MSSSSPALIKCNVSAGIGPTLLPWLLSCMFLSCEAHSYKYDNGTGAEIERKLTPLCEQSNLDAAPLMCHTSCCGGHLLTTLSTHPPSSLKDKSPRFERLDRSGPLVTDQSSSIRRLRLRFTYLCSHCIFSFCLRWRWHTFGPPPVLHWWFWDVSVAFVFMATPERKDFFF